jgi:uncharacterized protein (TIGR00369 family)
MSAYPTQSPERIAQLTELMRIGFRDGVPHNKELGLEVLELGPASATLSLPYDERFVGNPETGVLHGGVITTLVDATCGAAVFVVVDAMVSVATLDLRIDYLKPATPGRTVIAKADVIKTTRNVAFVRAFAYHDDASDAIAAASGTFMLQTPGRSVAERTKGERA